jgi:hypothetical protein
MDATPSIQPAALKWHENGELAPQDLFQLVRRLREVEPTECSNELWRLGHKYPNRHRVHDNGESC